MVWWRQTSYRKGNYLGALDISPPNLKVQGFSLEVVYPVPYDGNWGYLKAA